MMYPLDGAARIETPTGQICGFSQHQILAASKDMVPVALRIPYILSLIFMILLVRKPEPVCFILEIHTKSNSHDRSHRRPKPNIPVFRRPGSLPGHLNIRTWLPLQLISRPRNSIVRCRLGLPRKKKKKV